MSKHLSRITIFPLCLILLFLFGQYTNNSSEAVIVAGVSHTCGLTADGWVKCWGGGILGDGNSNANPNTPVDVVGLTSGVKDIAAGHNYSCALTITGGVKCWGYNNYGELGDGTNITRLTPVDVFGLSSGVKDITAGRYHSCALMESGEVKCWGYNGWGSLGDGTNITSYTPVNVVGLSTGVQALTEGSDAHTCVLTSTGGVKCWGFNAYGQLDIRMNEVPPS